MRNVHRDRSERLRRLLVDTAPWLRVAPASVGLQLMARLGPDSPDEATILAAADAASVGVMGLQTHHAATSTGPGLSIGFSRPAEHHFPTVLQRLGELFASF